MSRSILSRVWILLFGGTLALTGCAPSAFPKELVTVSDRVVTSVSEQAILEKYASRLGGQVIEPGTEAYSGVLYVAGVKLKGVSGQINLDSEGGGTGKNVNTQPPANSQVPTLVDEVNKLRSVPTSQPANLPQ